MATDPFGPGEESVDFDEGYWGTISSIDFKIGQFGDLEAVIDNRYDEPRPKGDGTLSLGRPEFLKVAGGDQGFVITDGGASFTHPEGKNYRSNSAWGQFVTRVHQLAGNGDAKKGVEELVNLGRQRLVGVRLFWDLEGQGDPYDMPVTTDSLGWMQKQVNRSEAQATRDDKPVTELRDGDHFYGKKKGKRIPTEIDLAGKASNGQVASFDLGTLSSTVYEAFSRAADAAETPGEFTSKALSEAMLIQDPVEQADAKKALSDAPRIYEALRS